MLGGCEITPPALTGEPLVPEFVPTALVSSSNMARWMRNGSVSVLKMLSCVLPQLATSKYSIGPRSKFKRAGKLTVRCSLSI